MQAEQPVAIAIGVCARLPAKRRPLAPRAISACARASAGDWLKTLSVQICALCTGEQVMVAVVNADAVRSPNATLARQRATFAESLRGLITGERNTP